MLRGCLTKLCTKTSRRAERSGPPRLNGTPASRRRCRKDGAEVAQHRRVDRGGGGGAVRRGPCGVGTVPCSRVRLVPPRPPLEDSARTGRRRPRDAILPSALMRWSRGPSRSRERRPRLPGEGNAAARSAALRLGPPAELPLSPEPRPLQPHNAAPGGAGPAQRALHRPEGAAGQGVQRPCGRRGGGWGGWRRGPWVVHI